MYEATADAEVQSLYPIVEVDDISGPVLFPRVRCEIEWRYADGRGDGIQRATVGPDGGISIFLPDRREDGRETPCDVYARRLPMGAVDPMGAWHRIYRILSDVRVTAEQADA